MNKIIFFGTDDFAVEMLRAMLDDGREIVAVVTKPDRPKHRKKKLLPTPVKEFCMERNLDIPIFQPEKASTGEFARVLRGFSPDLFVVVSYGEIISEELLAIPRLMPINIHPSALPKYRGAAPLRTALLHGDKEIGIAIIEMVKAMDAGAVIKYDTMLVEEGENHSLLEKRMFGKAAKVLLACLDDFEKGSVKKALQEGTPTFTKKFTKADTEISWEEGASKVLQKIRAFGEKPGAYCMVKVGEETLSMKILQARQLSTNCAEKFATLSFDRSSGWVIALPDGEIEILQVQLQNKKAMDAKSFINGMRAVAPKFM
ncbi:methionyl-tRNA formyltransferase [bacterium]|nr:methionyl-tRNA formyltransferase [bacterium]